MPIKLITQITRFVGILVPLAILCGCSTPIQSEAPHPPVLRRQLVKNYAIGQMLTVNVGEPMIKFQDYWLEDSEAPVAIPSKTVELTGGIVTIKLVAGKKYPVRGKYTLDGVDYTIVATTDDLQAYGAVLLKSDGSLHNRVVGAMPDLNGWGYPSGQPPKKMVKVIYTFTISDPSVRLTRETNTNIQISKGYENYELLYTGISSNALNLTYREFSPEGLARVAFFQSLTYEAAAKSITFKKYRIHVDKASSESISFTVLADGN